MADDTLGIFFDVIGLLGGILNALCLIPQLAHMYKTMNASGLHKRYFFISLVGFGFDMMYLVYINAWAAWVPMVITVWYIHVKFIFTQYQLRIIYLQIALTFIILIFKAYLDYKSDL